MKKIISFLLIISITLTTVFLTNNNLLIDASGSDTLTLQVGSTQTLYCGLYYNDGYNKTWVSSNSSVASIVKNNGAYCTIKLNSIGSCNVYFSVRYKKFEIVDYVYGKPIFGYREYADDFTYNIKVTKSGDQVPSSVSIGDSLTVKPGKSLIIIPTIKDENNHYKYNYNKLIWKSSNTRVATVNQIGVVTGWANGSAEISATTPEGVKDTCIVSVNNPSGYTKISNASQLNSIRNNPSGNYILTGNITFNDSDFSNGGSFYNSGNEWLPIEGFTGKLDGNGFFIKNLHVKMSNGGLFNNFKGTINDLEIRDSKISGSGSVGAFVGLGESFYLYNCKSTNNTITGAAAGGFAGNIRQYGYFFNCINTSSVVATTNGGGIAGFGSYTSMYLCSNNGGVKCSNGNAGGLLGKGGSSNTIKYCNNKAVVVGSLYTGGIVGYTGVYSQINSSYNTGKITGNANEACLGGIIGKGFTTYIVDCYNSGALELISVSSGNIGGLSGVCSDLSYSPGEDTLMLLNSYNIGSMKASGSGVIRVGGISGSITGTQGISGQNVAKNCYFLNTPSTLAIPYIQYGNALGLTALSAAQMKSQSSFKEFDLTNVWVMKHSALSPTLCFMDFSNGLGTVSAPKTICAVYIGNNSTEISFENSQNSAGYEIYRSTTTNENYTKIASVSLAAHLSYIDSNLKPGTTYFYKVRAYNTIGITKTYSPYTSEVFVKAFATTVTSNGGSNSSNNNNNNNNNNSYGSENNTDSSTNNNNSSDNMTNSSIDNDNKSENKTDSSIDSNGKENSNNITPPKSTQTTVVNLPTIILVPLFILIILLILGILAGGTIFTINYIKKRKSNQ